MKNRTLGREGLEVSCIGLGVMGMSEFYGTPDEAECIATLERAVELGVSFWDTADAYGNGHNEELIGSFLSERGWRDRIVVATKFGFIRKDGKVAGISGKPEYVKSACDASLARLGIGQIDLYYQHRVDPRVPIARVETYWRWWLSYSIGEVACKSLVNYQSQCTRATLKALTSL